MFGMFTSPKYALTPLDWVVRAAFIAALVFAVTQIRFCTYTWVHSLSTYAKIKIGISMKSQVRIRAISHRSSVVPQSQAYNKIFL